MIPPKPPVWTQLSLRTTHVYMQQTARRAMFCERSSVGSTLCKRWNIKINEDKTRAIYFTCRNRPPDSLLKLNGRSLL
jgi:hypothetical protein